MRSVNERIYEPAGMSVEHSFPMDIVMHGNVRIAGIKCMQRIGRRPTEVRGRRTAGYIFDVNKQWRCGSRRRGMGWQGDVARYICIVVEPTTHGTLAAQGLFIFPREYVFHNAKGDGPSHRGRLLVYPPSVRPRNCRSEITQKAQSEFYISFGALTKEEQIEKTKKLLGI
eukprot:g10247.t1